MYTDPNLDSHLEGRSVSRSRGGSASSRRSSSRQKGRSSSRSGGEDFQGVAPGGGGGLPGTVDMVDV